MIKRHKDMLGNMEKITYKGDTYTIDFVKNALNSAGECIGGFLEL